jgi:hypothetical protein
MLEDVLEDMTEHPLEQLFFVFLDLIANDTANDSPANRASGTAASEHGATKRADAGTDCRTLVASRHVSAAGQAQ